MESLTSTMDPLTSTVEPLTSAVEPIEKRAPRTKTARRALHKKKTTLFLRTGGRGANTTMSSWGLGPRGHAVVLPRQTVCRFLGSTGDVKGSTGDVTGSIGDVTGSIVDVKGSTLDVKGSTVDVKGSIVD
eukprot:167303-Prorocentrum_minimum.AAC.1